MKTKQLVRSTALLISGTILTCNAAPISVNFIEGAENTDITVQSSGFTGVGVPPSQTVSPEAATFTGYQLGNLGAGSYAIGLLESPNGPLSDYVTIQWVSGLASGITFLAQFTLAFHSDADGQPLQPPPGGFDVTAVEDGTLQTFKIPSTAFDLSVGMQSDAEGNSVPEAGTTVFLLALGLAGIGIIQPSRNTIRR